MKNATAKTYAIADSIGLVACCGEKLPFRAPLRGLGIGQQLAWLTKQLQGLGVQEVQA